ncbi:protein kinase domain-containing protein [Streptacidiphilus jiangxiensis]|uniref:Serine/threonine protein kinase n=1 Tax=Streptacidiphilus jiangxiensis TaxID=235985 RepID=A0A1H7RCC6_STRJI|nr:serine/threonine-protein kinase [Streptacidiphilus jiangxiensis]SEL57638.1 Serine/threonine protein kinase [Streptacidiphilus jiangxiensis]
MQPLEADDPAVIGPYRLVARLGAGGMGRVYLARSAGGRTVAVKVVRADLADNPDFRDRFRREVAAAQAVDAAYTAPVVDADRDSATPWLATAYVLGPSLTEAVVEHGPLPEESVRALGAVLAEALASIHGAGLIHRDLKPSNVLLAADGPRVIDFGIARALDGAGAALTSTGVVVGSPGFMSPEQASGKKVGPEGDVFSLGSVLAFAATGHGPFGQESAASLLYRVVHEEPDLERVPSSLREAIGACLMKDPASRPTPQQLLQLLAPDGAAALLRGGWLPGQVASGIAQHAARVMELETPAPVVAGQDPRAAAGTGAQEGGTVILGATGATGGSGVENGTVVLGGSGTGNGGAAGGGATPVPAPTAAAEPSRRKVLYGALGAAAVVAAGGGAALALSNGNSPKPKPNSNDQAHGSGSPAPQPSRPPGVAPTPVWTYQANQKVDCPPVLLGHSLLVTDESLVALDPRSGAKQWTGPTLQPSLQQPPFGFGGGFVVTLPSNSPDTIAGYDPSSGGQKWSVGSPKQYQLHNLLGVNDQAAFIDATKYPLDASGNVNIMGTTEELALAVDLHTRKLLWEQKRNVQPGAGQDVLGFATDKYLVYTNDNNNVVVRDAVSGAQLWSQDYGLKGFPNPEMPLLAQDTLYLPGNKIVGYGLAKGDTVMTAPQQGTLGYGNLGYKDGVLYCTLGLGTVLALDAHTGSQLWTSSVQLSLDSSPLVVVQDTVFCTVATATGGDAIAALDRTNGHVLWTFTDAGAQDADWWCATDGTMLYVAHDNHVYALPSR